ncbi:MAG: hypothetical protein HYZ54_07935 [Ignavibacteriae bacterium]|nr:hypothetical protein [Ignavibacteriota bacterium]
MKKMFLFVLLVVGCVSDGFAQDIDPLAVGVFIAGKGSMNLSKTQTGIENGFVVAPLSDFGVTGYIPVSKRKNMGVLLDLGLSSYSYSQKPTSNVTDDNTITHKFNYFTIGPSFTASYITFGFNLGLPMGVSRKNGSGSEVSTIDPFKVLTINEPKVDTIVYSDVKDNLQPILEIRVGTIIPIVKTSLGRLNVFANVGYMMSNLIKDEHFRLSSLKDTNPSVFSVSIGVNFLLGLESPESDE